LRSYEQGIEDMRIRAASARRVSNTAPSHPMKEHVGVYRHPGYGEIQVALDAPDLLVRRGELEIPLEHWHYDVWVAKQWGKFPLNQPNPFDHASRWMFEGNADGDIAALLIPFEPAVAAIRFCKQ
jgi:Domain of unknown function (DUF3471)